MRPDAPIDHSFNAALDESRSQTLHDAELDSLVQTQESQPNDSLGNDAIHDTVIDPTLTLPPEQTSGSSLDHDNTLAHVRLSQELDDIATILPALEDFNGKAEGDPRKMQEMWKGGKGKQRLSWGERETRIIFACVLKVEESEGEKLVEVKKKRLVRVPVKSVDNQLSKTVQTYIAWNLRNSGNSLFASIDNGQVKNHWVKLKSMWDAINNLSDPNRSGAPFHYDIEKGFSGLDDSMAAQFDALVAGDVAKGHELSHLVRDAQLAKDPRSGPWPYYRDMARIFEKKGGSSTIKGTYALHFVNRGTEEGAHHGQDTYSGNPDSGFSTAIAEDHIITQTVSLDRTRSQSMANLSPHDEPKPKRSRTSRPSQTIEAVKEVGEGNKAVGAALAESVKQEAARADIDRGILQELSTSNLNRQKEAALRTQCLAAEAVSNLPEFDTLTSDQQFAVQDWLTEGDHAETFLRVIPKIRGAWLRKRLDELLPRCE